MKVKKNISYFLTTFIIILIVSCTSQDDRNNNLINDSYQKNSLTSFINVNSGLIQSLNREQIAAFNGEAQKVILRFYSPQKRQSIWQEKVNYLLTSTELSVKERNFMKWFADKFKLISYEKAMSPNLSQELYDKAIEGSGVFGWTKEEVYKMFFTVGNIGNDKVSKDVLDSPVVNGLNRRLDEFFGEPDPESNGTWCECLYDLGCPTWNCDSDANCDDDRGDPDNPHDCGIFGDSDCDGNCTSA